MIWIILILIIGYLLGSISPAYIIGKAKGVDIRKVGSKNAGATNAWKSLGKLAGVITAVFDVFKGMFALLLGLYLSNIFGFSINWAFIAGALAIVGHNWPFYMQFKGGKGVATTYGLMIFSFICVIGNYYLNMWIFIISFAVSIIILSITKKPNIIYFIFSPIIIGLLIYLAGINSWTIFALLLTIYVYIRAIMTFRENRK